MEKVVGETFEDLSIAEMTMVQGSGDVQGELTPTTPACVYSVVVASRASSAKCAGAASAVSGAVLSAIRC
ncbi:TPA: lichenicidin A2 family type 2 lantibiotic [Staphylococcus aureus]